METKTRLPKYNFHSLFLILISDFFILSIKAFLSKYKPFPPLNDAYDKRYLGSVIRGLFCYAENNRHTFHKSGGHHSLIFSGLPTEATQLLESLGNIYII